MEKLKIWLDFVGKKALMANRLIGISYNIHELWNCVSWFLLHSKTTINNIICGAVSFVSIDQSKSHRDGMTSFPYKQNSNGHAFTFDVCIHFSIFAFIVGNVGLQFLQFYNINIARTTALKLLFLQAYNKFFDRRCA